MEPRNFFAAGSAAGRFSVAKGGTTGNASIVANPNARRRRENDARSFIFLDASSGWSANIWKRRTHRQRSVFRSGDQLMLIAWLGGPVDASLILPGWCG